MADQTAPFRDTLAARGIDPKLIEGMDDEAVLDVLVSNFLKPRYDPQTQQLIKWGQWAAANAEAIEQLLGEGAQPSPAAAAQAQAQAAVPQEKPYWEPGPEWDPRHEQYLRRDDEGNIVVAGSNDPTLAGRYMARKRWEENAIQRILSDPYAVVEPKVKSVLDAFRGDLLKQVQEWYAGERRQERDQQFTQSFAQANEAILYQRDAQGKTLRDPRNGQAVLSPAGVQFVQAIEELRAAGVTDPVAATQLALKMIGGAQPSAGAAHSGAAAAAAPSVFPTAPAVPPHVAARDRFLAQEPSGAHNPNRAGSFPTSSSAASAPPQNTSFLSMAQRMNEWIRQFGQPSFDV